MVVKSHPVKVLNQCSIFQIKKPMYTTLQHASFGQHTQAQQHHDCTARRLRCSVKVARLTSSVLMTSADMGAADACVDEGLSLTSRKRACVCHPQQGQRTHSAPRFDPAVCRN